MLVYNCYIVDDDPAAIEILQDYISQTPSLRLVHATTNARDLYNVIAESNSPIVPWKPSGNQAPFNRGRAMPSAVVISSR